MIKQNMQRIVIIGTTGSGKTFLTQRLATVLGLAMIDLDEFRFEKDWIEISDDVFRQKVTHELDRHAGWIVAGNYSVLRDILWPKADTLIWIDFGFWTTLMQLLRRTWRRVTTGEKVCNGNTENWDKVLSRQSILVWFFKTYWRNKKRYADIFENVDEFPHLAKVRLRNRQDVEHFIKKILYASAHRE
jgi:adenylate kinase family enzyme